MSQAAREASRRCYIKHAEQRRAKAKAQYQENKDVLRVRVRNSQLKSMYGITLTDYERMLQQQAGLCALCHTPLGEKTGRGTPHVDHCHKTGKVRGLLHHRCNTVLGFIENHPAILTEITRYLQ